MYEGLHQITFANRQLHADVANLEPLLGRADDGPIALETITFWRERLEKELATGQLRAEIVYLFGSLPEEWASGTTETAETSDQREQLRAALVERLLQPAETGTYFALLDTLLAESAFNKQEERAQALLEAVGTRLQEQIQLPELAAVLEYVSSSPHHAPLIRRHSMFWSIPCYKKNWQTP